MAYDPFAPVPVPAPAAAPAVVPQVMPNPVPVDPTLAPNNALAGTVAPTAVPSTVASTAVAPATDATHPMSFVGPDGRIANMQGFMQALQSWRGDRPDRPAGPMDQSQRQDWRSQLSDWRAQRPGFGAFGFGGAGGFQGGSWGGGQTPPPGSNIGMVAGVPGSMGLNAGAGPAPSGVDPIMTPGGGGTGAPLQGGQYPNWRAPRGRMG